MLAHHELEVEGVVTIARDAALGLLLPDKTRILRLRSGRWLWLLTKRLIPLWCSGVRLLLLRSSLSSAIRLELRLLLRDPSSASTQPIKALLASRLDANEGEASTFTLAWWKLWKAVVKTVGVVNDILAGSG